MPSTDRPLSAGVGGASGSPGAGGTAAESACGGAAGSSDACVVVSQGGSAGASSGGGGGAAGEALQEEKVTSSEREDNAIMRVSELLEPPERLSGLGTTHTLIAVLADEWVKRCTTVVVVKDLDRYVLHHCWLSLPRVLFIVVT